MSRANEVCASCGTVFAQHDDGTSQLPPEYCPCGGALRPANDGGSAKWDGKFGAPLKARMETRNLGLPFGANRLLVGPDHE